MTVRFASARHPARSPVARALAWRPLPEAANDDSTGPAIDAATEAALRHFARHGLAAARIAGERATAACDGGDSELAARWIEICGVLDARMAASFARSLGRNRP